MVRILNIDSELLDLRTLHYLMLWHFLYPVIYFRFTNAVYEVDENDGQVTVCVELNQAIRPIEDAVWLSIASQDDSAIGIPRIP